MVKIALTRDQARAVQQRFFPYIMLLLEKNLRDAEHNTTITDAAGEYLIAKLTFSLVSEVKCKIDKRLSGFASRFTFTFKDHEAIPFYKLLISLPIDPSEVWLINLRSYMINTFHYHLFRGTKF